MKKIGEIIKEHRKKRNLKQKELAEKVGISFKYLSDIETNRRNPSKQLVEKIAKVLLVDKEIFFQNAIKGTLKREKKDIKTYQLSINEEKLKTLSLELQEKEILLSKMEREIKIKKFEYEKLERTSGFRSKITWLCIEIQKFVSEKIIEIMSIYNLADEKNKPEVLPAIRQLVYHLDAISSNLKKIINDLEKMEVTVVSNQDAFSKYNVVIPKKAIKEFESEDMTKILTFKVGTVVPRILKDLDAYIDKKRQFTAKKASLLLNGKKDKRPNYEMKNYVGEYGSFFTEIEVNITKSLVDILEEVISDMNNYDKNENRKELFFNTVDSIEGQVFLFVIGVISLGEFLIKKFGYIKNGRYLEQVLMAKKELAKQITQIYKDMNKKIYTPEQARTMFVALIDKKIQDNMKIDMELYSEIKFEEDLFKMCDEESIDDLIYEIVEEAREKATGQIRMFELR